VTRIIVISLLLSLSSDLALGQDIASDFSEQLRKLRSLSGQFEQAIYGPDGDLLDRQTGQMTLQRPRLIRWEVERPRQLMLCDGEQIFLYDPDLQQVVVRPWREDPTQNPASLFTADVVLSDWFSIDRDNDGVYSLAPKDSSSIIDEILVNMSAAGIPEGFSVLDSSGQLTRISFTIESVNEPIAVDQFEFVVPVGVDVIVDE
jgi:outer membrane lipoprotein carrier protein